MKTTDAAGNPIPADELLLAINRRAGALWIIADEIGRDPDAASPHKVEALAHGVLALIEDIGEAATSDALHEVDS